MVRNKTTARSDSRQSKNFCFTLNNYTTEEHEAIKQWFVSSSIYSIIGEEVGEEGTRHLQGYCSLKAKTRFPSIKIHLSPRAHIEYAKGDGSSNFLYCSKGGIFWEHGVRPEPAVKKRTRDSLAVEWTESLGKGREGIQAFATNNPGTYAWSGHVLLRNSLGLAGAQPRPEIRVRWIYGSPGVGKSRFAHSDLPNAYIKDPRTKWWNGYLLEKDVIIDDFGPNGIDINHLLRWFDRYKCYVEVKGDMCPLLGDNFIVTSNFHPSVVFTCHLGVEHPQLPALLRRIELIEM